MYGDDSYVAKGTSTNRWPNLATSSSFPKPQYTVACRGTPSTSVESFFTGLRLQTARTYYHPPSPGCLYLICCVTEVASQRVCIWQRSYAALLSRVAFWRARAHNIAINFTVLAMLVLLVLMVMFFAEMCYMCVCVCVCVCVCMAIYYILPCVAVIPYYIKGTEGPTTLTGLKPWQKAVPRSSLQCCNRLTTTDSTDPSLVKTAIFITSPDQSWKRNSTLMFLARNISKLLG